MAEDLTIIQGSKEEIYLSLIPQIKGLLEGEPDLIANPRQNVAAALKEQFGWLWVGFISSGEKNWCLALPGTRCLHPYQKGRGGGTRLAESGKRSSCRDVEKFPGHIACSLSRSEIVVPVIRNGEVAAVLMLTANYWINLTKPTKYSEEIVGPTLLKDAFYLPLAVFRLFAVFFCFLCFGWFCILLYPLSFLFPSSPVSQRLSGAYCPSSPRDSGRRTCEGTPFFRHGQHLFLHGSLSAGSIL